MNEKEETFLDAEKHRVRLEVLNELEKKITTELNRLSKRKESFLEDEDARDAWVGIFNDLCGLIDGLKWVLAEIQRMRKET